MTKDDPIQEFVNSLDWDGPKANLIGEVKRFLMGQYPTRNCE